MAPTFDGASPDHNPAYEAEAVPSARWLHKGESQTLRLPTSLGSSHLLRLRVNLDPVRINEGKMLHRTAGCGIEGLARFRELN